MCPIAIRIEGVDQQANTGARAGLVLNRLQGIHRYTVRLEVVEPEGSGGGSGFHRGFEDRVRFSVYKRAAQIKHVT